ncbi:MAG: hypothetical protein RIQ33_92 [Bacteroidota bacterium]
MESFDNNAKFAAQQYAKALNTLDVEPIAFLLQDDFKFIFPLSKGTKDGITTDIRYVGYLYKTFSEMRKEGVFVKAEVRHFMYEATVVPCIVLLPPQDVRLIYTKRDFNESYSDIYHRRYSKHVYENEVLFALHMHNKLLRKVEVFHLYKTDKKTMSSELGEIKFI